MNHLYDFSELKNRYLALRHGRSEANEAGIILSNPSDGVSSYGLTVQGRKQAQDAVKKSKLLSNVSKSDIVIYCSDFKRAFQTAYSVAKIIGVENVITSEKLRERFFGNFDKSSDSNYEKVWLLDKKDSSHTENGVESADSVQQRTSKMIVDLEKKYLNKTVLLVSHGDALQILQTAFLKQPASVHRDLPHLETGEIRELVLKL